MVLFIVAFQKHTYSTASYSKSHSCKLGQVSYAGESISHMVEEAIVILNTIILKNVRNSVHYYWLACKL